MRLCLVLFFLCLATQLRADMFASVGRIEVRDGPGACSAALIAPDIVVTAAHCVDAGAGQSHLFQLGNGLESIPVMRIVVHPLYADLSGQRLRRLRFDIAVAKLSRPVDSDLASGFPLGEEAKPGERLFMASWRAGPRPRERRCLVVETDIPGIVALGCRVRGGESGAPILRMTETGLELVAIVNSSANDDGRSVAFASDVRGRIAPLLTRLNAGP